MQAYTKPVVHVNPKLIDIGQWWRTFYRPSAQTSTRKSLMYSKVPTQQVNLNGTTGFGLEKTTYALTSFALKDTQ